MAPSGQVAIVAGGNTGIGGAVVRHWRVLVRAFPRPPRSPLMVRWCESRVCGRMPSAITAATPEVGES